MQSSNPTGLTSQNNDWIIINLKWACILIPAQFKRKQGNLLYKLNWASEMVNFGKFLLWKLVNFKSRGIYGWGPE